MREELIKQLKKSSDSPQVIDEAVGILKKHMSENRLDFAHSLRVGRILQRIKADEITVVSAILHHVPTSEIKFKRLSPEQQTEIKTLIKKIEQLRGLSAFEKPFKAKPLRKWRKIFLNQQAENLRKMFFVVSRDLKPIFITLAGRLDEMRNFLSTYTKEKRLQKCGAAVEILAPLAYGLGIGQMKGEFEDRAFPVLYPKEYQWLLDTVQEKYARYQEHTDKIKPEIEKILKQAEVEFSQVDARTKHYFSLYQKLLRHNMDINQIYDLVALRVIVPDIETCYKALGAIHNVFKPVYGRIKDYISSPKPNGYRSLHTTVACPQCSQFIEMQIKTIRMHQEAEYGAAAHFAYKGKLPQKTYQHQFYWLDNLRKWQEEIQDKAKIAEHLRNELFKERVFVFTPKGEIINLPKGATAVDFAYAVHSEIGQRCSAIKIDGKMSSLKQELKTGQTAEILTDKNKAPSADWLRFVKTQKARAKIRSFLEQKQGISLAKPDRIKTLKEKVALLKRIIPLRRPKESQILIGGSSGIATKFSKCCNPKPGDEVISFITKGQGASVHKPDCPRFKELKHKWPHRIVEATWKN